MLKNIPDTPQRHAVVIVDNHMDIPLPITEVTSHLDTFSGGNINLLDLSHTTITRDRVLPTNHTIPMTSKMKLIMHLPPSFKLTILGYAVKQYLTL